MEDKVIKFSMKKLLLTILFSSIVAMFIGFTILFIYVMPKFLLGQFQMSVDPNSNLLVEWGQSMEDSFDEIIAEQKENYDEEYPTIGVLLNKMIYVLTTESIVYTYLISLVCGIFLGSIIYIVFVQKARGKKLLIELILAIIVIALIVLLVYFGYNYSLNKIVESLNN